MPRQLKPFGGQKRFAGMPTRLQMHAANNLGVIMGDQLNKKTTHRSDDLDLLDQYYENSQYDNLQKWDEALDVNGEYVPVRKRKPRIIWNVAKLLTDKVAAKLVGSAVFPKFIIEDDPDDTTFFRVVQQAAGFRRNLVMPIKKTLLAGSSFVRFYIVNGVMEMEYCDANHCYPQFDEVGELESIEIKYVYEDQNESDAAGKFKQKWYRMVLSKTSDILFDNPEYREGSQPEFTVVAQADHNLGWVQGEWLRTSKHKFDCDGDSLIGDILDFIDDANYSLSQSSQAVSYNQDPQLTLNKMDEDEIDKLIRSSQKGWNLGREGEAKFLESTMKGVEAAEENRDHNRHRMLEVVRVVLHDPEKIAGNAQSGKAMETLNAPLVELVDELRTVFEPQLKNLLIKMAMTFLEMNARGEATVLQTPKGYMPTSLDITVQWPAIYPLTIEDIQKKAIIANTLAMASVISRESLTRWLAPDVGIEDIDEELSKIASQPIINPFGSFGGP